MTNNRANNKRPLQLFIGDEDPSPTQTTDVFDQIPFLDFRLSAPSSDALRIGLDLKEESETCKEPSSSNS